MRQASSYRKGLEIRKKYIQKKIERLDVKIEKMLKSNDFLSAEKAEQELYNWECELLKTYNSDELNKLYNEGYSA